MVRTPAWKRYNWRVIWLSLAYAAFLLPAVYGFKHALIPGALQYVVAILPALPIIGIFIAIGRYLVEEEDEYVRMLMVRQILWASGFALSVAAHARWSYPTAFLALVSREGSGGLLPKTSHPPFAIQIEGDVIASIRVSRWHELSARVGLAVAPHADFSPEELPLLDFPFLYPRFAPMYSPLVPRAGVDAEGRLEGIVPARRLLVSEPSTPLDALMLKNVVTIPSWATCPPVSDSSRSPPYSSRQEW